MLWPHWATIVAADSLVNAQDQKGTEVDLFGVWKFY